MQSRRLISRGSTGFLSPALGDRGSIILCRITLHGWIEGSRWCRSWDESDFTEVSRRLYEPCNGVGECGIAGVDGTRTTSEGQASAESLGSNHRGCSCACPNLKDNGLSKLRALASEEGGEERTVRRPIMPTLGCVQRLDDLHT